MTDNSDRIVELSSAELEEISGGWIPLAIAIGKAVIYGAGLGATAVGIKLAVEDVSGGHNHYGK